MSPRVYDPVIVPGAGVQLKFWDGDARAWIITASHGTFPDHATAKVKVDELNRSLGMEPREAFTEVLRHLLATDTKTKEKKP